MSLERGEVLVGRGGSLNEGGPLPQGGHFFWGLAEGALMLGQWVIIDHHSPHPPVESGTQLRGGPAPIIK